MMEVASEPVVQALREKLFEANARIAQLSPSAEEIDERQKLVARLRGELSETHARISHILKSSSEVIRPCKACGATLYFVKAPRTGKLQPFEESGLNHFATCPEAKDFKRRPAE